MTTLLQCSREDLRIEIKSCFRESIEEIKSIPAPPKLTDRCTLREACEITELSSSLIYKLSMEGAIPREKYGKRLIFSRKKLAEWVESRTVSAPSPSNIMTERLAITAKKRRSK